MCHSTTHLHSEPPRRPLIRPFVPSFYTEHQNNCFYIFVMSIHFILFFCSSSACLYKVSPLGCFRFYRYFHLYSAPFSWLNRLEETLKKFLYLLLPSTDIAAHISHSYGYRGPSVWLKESKRNESGPAHCRDCAHKHHTSCCSSFPAINHLMAGKRKDSAWPYTQMLALTPIRRGLFFFPPFFSPFVQTPLGGVCWWRPFPEGNSCMSTLELHLRQRVRPYDLHSGW